MKFILSIIVAVGIVLFAGLTYFAKEDEARSAQKGTVLVTGSNRGIGLAFATQYAQKGWTVIATHRRDTVPDTLAALAEQFPNVMPERMDVLHHDQIEALAAKLDGMPIDVLINNAGIMFTRDPSTTQVFGTLTYDRFDLFMRTNALGPIKIAETFMPNLKASQQKKIVNISSSSGRLSNPPGHSKQLWYRASKTALNGLMVASVPVARESGITIVMFEPGWTWTGKDESRRDPAQMDPSEVVAAMIDTIADLTIEDTGRFLQRDGSTQPW